MDVDSFIILSFAHHGDEKRQVPTKVHLPQHTQHKRKKDIDSSTHLKHQDRGAQVTMREDVKPSLDGRILTQQTPAHPEDI